MSVAVVLFAKAPVPGRAKTRLTPPLSAEQAADFHRACVCDAWESIGTTSASRYLYTDVPWTGSPEPAPPEQIRFQRGNDLGERMLNCFLELYTQNIDKALIIGSDSPSLPAAYRSEAVEALAGSDDVIGPSEDGGFYLIGCRQPHPRMFAGVPWSSPQTSARTEDRLRSLGRSIHKLPPWYDVDTPGDLRRLAAEASLPAHVGRWIDEHRSLLA
jgi:hypothetical protein